MMIKVSVIINGIGRLSSEAQKTIEKIKESELLDAHIIRTTKAKEAISIAKEQSLSYDLVIAVGGDGTAHEVLNGIMQGNQNVLFGIIPSGTGNDFQRSIGVFDSEKFLKAVIEKKHLLLDIGACKSQLTTTYFLNIADLGFGAKVVQTMNSQRLIGVKGKLSYALAILRTFFTYKKSNIKITTPEFSYEGRVLMVAFCNGSTFGHGLTIHPKAAIDSGEMAITIIGNVSLFTYVKNLRKLKKGIKINHPEVQYTSSISFKIKTRNEFIRFEADGELYRNDYTEVSVLPRAIQLLSPDV